MVRYKSYSETEGERVLASRMVEIMRESGLEAELTPVEGDRVNAIGRWRGAGGGSSLLFNGHLDTNPVGGGWTVDPWGGLVDEKYWTRRAIQDGSSHGTSGEIDVGCRQDQADRSGASTYRLTQHAGRSR